MEVVLGLIPGLIFPQHMYDQERHIKFGGHLGGFGADMFEAEINKLKEKNRTLCLPQGVLWLIKSLYKPELMCRKVNLLI